MSAIISPRQYQERMVCTAIENLLRKATCLIKAATGAGKTIVFAELIRRWLNEYQSMRVLVLVHREVIVRQNADKLRAVWPDAPIGIACASASSKVDVGAQVVFGSVQTMASRLETMPKFHLAIVDEAHRLPPKTEDSQYKRVLDRLALYYPTFRLFGLTATPFRLGWGNIYGRNHKRTSDDEPIANWFDTLDLEIGIRELQAIQPDDDNPDAPYLCGMRAFVEDKSIGSELESVTKTAGEYNQRELSDLMQKTIHLQTALDAYRKHCAGRTRCVVFGVDISHAEQLRKIFSAAGVETAVVHSEKAKDHNRRILAEFDAGQIPVVVNVGVMTEGWDCRGVDLILLCRPTMSAALFVQIIGRGLRPFAGKQDVLVLDLAGNFNRHGAPWEPVLPDYSHPGRPKQPTVKVERKCPACGHMNPANTKVCEACGEILIVKQVVPAKSVSLRELNLERMAKAAAEKAAIAAASRTVCRIKSMVFSSHITRKGDRCLKVTLGLEPVDGARYSLAVFATHWYRLDGPGAWYFRQWWRAIAPGMPVPETVSGAIEARSSVAEPMREVVAMKNSDGYWKVLGW
jgi:DNA repair protein RadD